VNNTPKQGNRTSKAERQREALIAAMLQYPTVERAAAACGISVKTAYRVRQTEAFQEAYWEARKAVYSDVRIRIQQASPVAANVVLSLMANTATPPAVRQRIAFGMLELAAEMHGSEELERRVAKLENKARMIGPGLNPEENDRDWPKAA
jgi:hypothetical protein